MNGLISFINNQLNINNMDKYDLENQYQLYLKRVGLVESKMAPLQKKQLRQTFMGAYGQLLMLLRDDITKMEDNVAVLTIQNMFDQVANYFAKQVIQG